MRTSFSRVRAASRPQPKPRSRRPDSSAAASVLANLGRATVRRSPRAEFKHRRHQRIEVDGVGAVVDDGGAYRELSIERCGRWRSDAGFLDVGHDLDVDAIGFVRTITEADDIELSRREQF